jgi:hypothetical protein
MVRLTVIFKIFGDTARNSFVVLRQGMVPCRRRPKKVDRHEFRDAPEANRVNRRRPRRPTPIGRRENIEDNGVLQGELH